MTALHRPRVRLPRPLGAPTPRQALWVLAVSAAAFAVVRALSKHTILGDLHVYLAEGMAIRNGTDLYALLPGQHLLATYPPFAGVVFMVLTPIPVAALQILSFFVNFGLLVLVCRLMCRFLGVTGRDALVATCLFAAIGLWSEPVFTTFAYGQINLALLALILWDFTLPESSRWRGVGTGLAAGMKVTPGIVIVYLILTKRFRAALRASITFAATIAVSVIADPHDTWKYWTHYLFDLHRVGKVEYAANQSLRGVFVRAFHSETLATPLVGVIAVILIAGIAIAWRAYYRLGDEWGLPAAAVTGLLISPISWTHHWVWELPIAMLCWFRARRWVIAVFLIFMSWLVWVVPPLSRSQLHLTGGEVALSCLYVLFGLGFLTLTARRALTAPAMTAGGAPSAAPRRHPEHPRIAEQSAPGPSSTATGG